VPAVAGLALVDERRHGDTLITCLAAVDTAAAAGAGAGDRSAE
jgi:hypothetical protein